MIDITLGEGIAQVGAGLVSLLLSLLAWGIKVAASKVKSEMGQNALFALDSAVYTAVSFTNATYVQELKDRDGDGKLSGEEAKVAWDKTWAAIKAQLGPKLWGEVTKNFGGAAQTEEALRAKVESAVASSKK